MKKSLLLLAAAAMTFAAQAITADEAAQMTLRFDYRDGKPMNTSVNTTDALIVESSTAGMWEVKNFYNDTNLKITIADDGTVTVAPQMLGGDYDYTTYEMVYYMIVPQSAVEKAPMEFTNDRVYGHYADGKLSLEAWNIVTVNQSFSENKGAKFTGNMTTTIAAPNATTARGMWMADLDDNDKFIGWDKLSVWPARYNVRVDKEDTQLTIANFLGMYTECPVATFDLDLAAKTVTFPAGQVVIVAASGNEYTICAIPETLVNQHQEGLDDLVVGTIADDMKTITLRNFCVMQSNEMFRNIDYCHGNPVYELTIVLDEPLDGATAVDANLADKTVAGVKYVNLAGMTSDEAFKGVNIMVTTYSDGTVSSTKVVR